MTKVRPATITRLDLSDVYCSLIVLWNYIAVSPLPMPSWLRVFINGTPYSDPNGHTTNMTTSEQGKIILLSLIGGADPGKEYDVFIRSYPAGPDGNPDEANYVDSETWSVVVPKGFVCGAQPSPILTGRKKGHKSNL